MRIISTVLFLVILTAFIGYSFPGSDSRDLIREELHSIVFVTAEEVDGLASGTAILINDNYFLTNSHIIHDGSNITLMSLERHKYNVQVIWDDQAFDLATIRLSDADWNKYKTENEVRFAIPNKDYRILNKVFALGHPNRLLFSASEGTIVRRTNRADARAFMIITDAAIYPGASGGILSDQNGHMIGINSRVIVTLGGGFGEAIPVEVIDKVMTDEDLYHENRPTYFGMSINPDGTVASFEDDSTAKLSGVKVGDKIISAIDYNGNKVVFRDNDERMLFSTTRQLEKPVVVNFMRDGKMLNISIVPEFSVIPNDSTIPE